MFRPKKKLDPGDLTVSDLARIGAYLGIRFHLRPVPLVPPPDPAAWGTYSPGGNRWAAYGGRGSTDQGQEAGGDA